MPPDATKGGAPTTKRRPTRSAARQAATQANSVRRPSRPGLRSLAECVVEVLVDLAAINREDVDEQAVSR